MDIIWLSMMRACRVLFLGQVDETLFGVESLTKRLVSLLTVRIKDALPSMKWELQGSLGKNARFSLRNYPTISHAGFRTKTSSTMFSVTALLRPCTDILNGEAVLFR